MYAVLLLYHLAIDLQKLNNYAWLAVGPCTVYNTSYGSTAATEKHDGLLHHWIYVCLEKEH